MHNCLSPAQVGPRTGDAKIPKQRFFEGPMNWLLPTLICALLGLPTATFGQSQTIERQYKAKPDTNINVGIFSSINKDCTAALLPVIRLVIPPAHGNNSQTGALAGDQFK